MVRPGRLKLEVDRRSRELLERLARLRKLDRRNEELAAGQRDLAREPFGLLIPRRNQHWGRGIKRNLLWSQFSAVAAAKLC
jgi:hypothetical protein